MTSASRAARRFKPSPDGLSNAIPIGLLRAVAVVPRALVSGEGLSLGIGVVGDNVSGHAVNVGGRDQPWLYRVDPDCPQDQSNEDKCLATEEDQQEP